MRKPGKLAVLILCAAVTIPISAESPYSHALIQSSCAPWDGPAIDVTLTREPAQCNRTDGPFLELGVWRGLPIHAGQEVKFDSGTNDGFATQCAKAGECERAQSGTIVFETYEDGSGAAGHYELHFKGGKTLSGTFDAKWCHNRTICG
jgi:hypothetical protein